MLPVRRHNDKASAGAIIFHDAWPTSWPNLEVDIVNSHHSKYYQGKDGGEAPGDWENPIPVYFLCVTAGATFSFALSRRRFDISDKYLELAREWLIGALCHMGAGAKTNSGYGSFQVSESEPVEIKELQKTSGDTVKLSRDVFETTLELVTPAFLAGANQTAEDCDLRPATLRGLLRWWWRTMHSAHMDVKILRQLESAIWGDTNKGGILRLEVRRESVIKDVYDKARYVGNDFEKPANRKTTQGLYYASFGMHDGKNQRYLVYHGSKWNIKITAKRANIRLDKNPIGADKILYQAQCALWLLCNHGGVGAKGHHGFGSLIAAFPMELSKDKCISVSSDFRSILGRKGASIAQPESSALDHMIEFSIKTKWLDPWYALDQTAYAQQLFAQKYKHRLEKKALGLPRKIGEPAKGQFNTVRNNLPRHSSPVHIHYDRDREGHLEIRIAAFPAKYLPDYTTSINFLKEYLSFMEKDLQKRVIEYAGKGKRNLAPVSSNQQSPFSGKKMPKANDRVQARLLKEKTKKGGWMAEHMDTGIKGNIINSDAVHPEKKPGDAVDLIVHSVNANKSFAFKWPVDAK